MATTKFYHYNLWIEGEDGRRIDPTDAIDGGLFPEEFEQISQNEDKRYSTQFQQIQNEQYHGVIVRTRDESSFVRLTSDGEMNLLSEELDDEGQTGDINVDYVDYGVQLAPHRFKILVEVGFQTPGIGVISNHIDNHIDLDEQYKLKYETEMVDDLNIDELLRMDLKKIEVSFKKNPKEYIERDYQGGLESSIPDDYRLKFTASLHQGDVEESRVDEAVGNILEQLGFGHSTVEESISQIDFPRIMNTFRIVGLEGDEEVEENLADNVKKEKIDTSGYGMFDSQLGAELCQRLVQR
ncbi:hypothetical protein [Halobaculum sp. EA56]|uniref:hypothetical protein n=1 Tax=Halobaculum sp. EA56 TaxID=3421648 RepID=UPI003EB8BF4B